MRKVWLLLFCGLICLSFDSEAQFNRKQIKKNNKRISSYRGRKEHFGKEKIYNAIGLSLNATNYYGDLSPKPSRFSTDIAFTRPGVGISFAHRFGPRYTFVGQFMVATLRGSDNQSADPDNAEYNGRYLRNLEFRNTIKELSAVAVFDLFENMATYISRVRWTPYVYAGVAGFISTPKGRAPEQDLFGDNLAEGGEWVKLRPLGTEGQYSNLPKTSANYGIKPYKSLQVAIPVGIGARFRINQVLDVWADIGFRYTFTDYLDDVSRSYVDLDLLDSPLAQAMSYRTNELPATQRPAATAPSGSSGILTVPGYGSEGTGTNIRGSQNDKDIYMVTSIKVTYILGATFHKAKFR
ncbi:MAG: DUF6089 family protein [Proteobacteria bacterium]|nr:DUF6089 family protein [Pseudomonadota bacterium]